MLMFKAPIFNMFCWQLGKNIKSGKEKLKWEKIGGKKMKTHRSLWICNTSSWPNLRHKRMSLIVIRVLRSQMDYGIFHLWSVGKKVYKKVGKLNKRVKDL